MSKVTTAFIAAALVFASADVTFARVWTDLSGRQVNASFVRTVGTQVILQVVGGGAAPVEYNTLSVADQTYLNEQGIRIWTAVDGRTVFGEFVRVKEGAIYLRIDGQMVNQPFDQFSRGDRLAIRELSAGKNFEADLPETTDAEAKQPESRWWQDTKGNAVEGSFDSMLPDGRVLVSGKLRTHIIAVNQLSEDDHEHLRAALAGDEDLVALIPEPIPEPTPTPPDNSVAVNTPPRSSGSTSTPTPSVVPAPYVPPKPYVPPAPKDYSQPPVQSPPINYQSPPRVVRESPRDNEMASVYATGRAAGIITRYVLIGLFVLGGIGSAFRYWFA